MTSTLFTNGTLLTMNPAQPRAEALLVRGDKIEAVGGREELRALCGDEPCREVDLAGNTLLPGFIDGHSHISQFAQSLRFAQLRQARSMDDLLKLLNAFIHDNNIPEGAWVVGMGYDPQRLREKAHPLRGVLDRIAGHPVIVTADSGHMGCMNSRALSLADVTAESADPAGGHIGREADGHPSGYLEENAFFSVAGVIPKPTEAELMNCLARAQQIYASFGVTTAQEGLMHPADFDLLRKAGETGRLTLDIVGYADIRERDLFPHGQPRWGLDPQNRFRVGGYKMFLDGSPQGRTAWLTTPYLPKDGQPAGYRGYPVMEDGQVLRFVRLAAQDGMQLLTHCNGDAAIDQLLDAHRQPSGTRNVIIHAQLMRRDQLPRVKALGLMPSYFVAHVHRYGDTHIQNLGMQRASLISPVRSTAELGIPYTLHQDTPVMLPNMLHTLYCAMCRTTEAGVLLGPDERVTLHQALLGVTLFGAYQSFDESLKGALRPGMRADLAVAQGDWLLDAAESFRDKQVLQTYRAGELIFERN